MEQSGRFRPIDALALLAAAVIAIAGISWAIGEAIGDSSDGSAGGKKVRMMGRTAPVVQLELAGNSRNASASGVVDGSLNGQSLLAPNGDWPALRRSLSSLQLGGVYGREFVECKITVPRASDVGDAVVRAWRKRGDPGVLYGFTAVHDDSMDLVGVEVGIYRVDQETFRAGSADYPSCA